MVKETLSIASYDGRTRAFGPETQLFGVTSWSGIRSTIDRVGRTKCHNIHLSLAFDLLMKSEKGKQVLRSLHQLPDAGEEEMRLTVRYQNGEVQRVKVFVCRPVHPMGYAELICNGPDQRGS